MKEQTGRCWGITRNFRLCRSPRSSGHFCSQHRRQPLYFTATVILAVATSYIGGLIPRPWKSGRLQVVAVTFTHDGALDIKLLNTSDVACFITRVEVTCLKAHNAWVKAPVHPSAAYVIPIEGMKTGDTRSKGISFTVPPKSPDRILLYVDSSQLYTLRVALRYNRNRVVRFTNTTWQFQAVPPGNRGASNDIRPARSEYVIWDGQEESPYTETRGVHDCVYLYDGLVSCQDVRKEFLRLGFVCTTLFACGSGQVAVTTTKGGLFTQSLVEVLRQNPQATIRDAVRLVNKSMHSQGFAQNSEVITRPDVLDLPFWNCTIPGEKHVLFLYDMCRTPISESERKNVKRHRVKPGDFGPLSEEK